MAVSCTAKTDSWLRDQSAPGRGIDAGPEGSLHKADAHHIEPSTAVHIRDSHDSARLVLACRTRPNEQEGFAADDDAISIDLPERTDDKPPGRLLRVVHPGLS